MQFKTLLIGALLPASLMASPTPEMGDHVTVAGGALDPRARHQFTRPQQCEITRVSRAVNCRDGPGTKYRVKHSLKRGRPHPFWCVQSGECVTINGFRNCGWHYVKDLDCFVNGHYTDNRCTTARMGKCDWKDNDKSLAKPFN
ncbi:hypothetical protein VTK26DRAFT_4132 [Humicola hyalothermophila]